MPRKSKRHLKRTKRTRRRNTRHRKYYNMIGCSNKHCKCSCHKKGGSSPIGGLPITNGGGCFGPLVGSAYSVDKGGNYYNLPKPEAYSVGMDMKLRGGGILPNLPENLVNVARNISYGAQTVANGLGGYESPTNPAPYVQNKI